LIEPRLELADQVREVVRLEELSLVLETHRAEPEVVDDEAAERAEERRRHGHVGGDLLARLAERQVALLAEARPELRSGSERHDGEREARDRSLHEEPPASSRRERIALPAARTTPPAAPASPRRLASAPGTSRPCASASAGSTRPRSGRTNRMVRRS